jgi:hypothetical protein
MLLRETIDAARAEDQPLLSTFGTLASGCYDVVLRRTNKSEQLERGSVTVA